MSEMTQPPTNDTESVDLPDLLFNGVQGFLLFAVALLNRESDLSEASGA